MAKSNEVPARTDTLRFVVDGNQVWKENRLPLFTDWRVNEHLTGKLRKGMRIVVYEPDDYELEADLELDEAQHQWYAVLDDSTLRYLDQPLPIQTQIVDDAQKWNALLTNLPYAHVLQSWQWGQFKQATTGWTPERLAFERNGTTVAAAQILTRRAGPFAISYVPKGPALNYTEKHLRNAVLAHLIEYARQRGAIFLKIDPDVVQEADEEDNRNQLRALTGREFVKELRTAGWRFSGEQVQFRNTGQIDLTQDEDALLAAMKQKTRYNIRLATRKEVTVRLARLEDLDTLYRLYAITAARDRFIIRPLDYYRRAWGDFMQAGLAQPFIAEHQGRALAHVILFQCGKRAWYFYGASADEARNRMPTYLLQWEAMRWAKAQGCTVYDLWGAPDDFADADDPLAGVWRFKVGFGPQAVRHIGAWDFPLRRAAYWAYTRAMPVVSGGLRSVARLR